MNPVTCLGKHGYPTKSDADRIAHLMSNRRDHRVTAYKCKECGWYHVGQKLGSEAAVRKYKQKRSQRKEMKYGRP